MACVAEAEEGEFVLIHAGIAISRINAAEAQRLIDDLATLADEDAWNEVRGTADGGSVNPGGEPP